MKPKKKGIRMDALFYLLRLRPELGEGAHMPGIMPFRPFMPPSFFIIFIMPPPLIFFIMLCIWSN